MIKRKYKQWEDIYPLTLEDIYPLTLVKLRYGDKYVAINCEEDSGHIQNVNTEEVHYHLEEWLDENVSPCPYGVGTTIMECMNNLLESMHKEEITMKGRKYYNVTNKNHMLKLLEEYKDRTDLDIQHPPPKLKWWQKLIGAFKGRRY